MIYYTKHICVFFLQCASTNASSNYKPDWKTFHTAHNCTVLCQCGSPCVWQGSLGGQMLWDTWHMDVFLPFLLLRTWSAFLELLALTVDFKWNIATGETSQVITSRHFSSLLFTSMSIPTSLVLINWKANTIQIYNSSFPFNSLHFHYQLKGKNNTNVLTSKWRYLVANFPTMQLYCMWIS